jgi:glyoxylase-like metal-dependent hydrolase (beta-lactamase superfamily II)
MPTVADELTQLTPSLFVWQSYDSAVKADLFSTAVVTPAGVFIVDPILLEPSQLDRLHDCGRIAGLIVTNANHHRAASWYSQEFSVPIFAAADVFTKEKPERFAEIEGGKKIEDEFEVRQIDGAVAGEVALYHGRDGGALIVGDALINFAPYGFTFLPRKYCCDQDEMRRSLRKLSHWPTKRIFFAHGIPILSDATERLRQLLDVRS